MAEGNAPKQDFAPPWLKFPPADSSKSATPKTNSYQNERFRQRREDPFHSKTDYSRLQRQSSFDFHEGQSKYRHHSVDDEDYYSYPYNCAYYPSDYNYEKYGMQYSSQPSLGRLGNRDGKYAPTRSSQMNGGHDASFGPNCDMFEPHYHQGSSRRGGHYDKDHYRRDVDGKGRDRVTDRDRPFSDDFPSLVGNGESNGDAKQSKPGSGVWDNPPKSSRHEDSSDLLKNTSPGIYKALVPSKNGAGKKPVREAVRMNGSIRESSPLSPSNKPNYKEVTRQSPTPDLAIVTQPKRLGDKKSEFLRALRNESSLRNGDSFQDQNQNAIDNKQKMMVNGGRKVNGESEQLAVNGEELVSDVDHISLYGEEEEKRLLLSMGWDEEDNTEYVITDDDIREFQDLLQNHCHAQKNGLKSSTRNALSKKLMNVNGVMNGSHNKKEENGTEPL